MEDSSVVRQFQASSVPIMFWGFDVARIGSVTLTLTSEVGNINVTCLVGIEISSLHENPRNWLWRLLFFAVC